MQRNSAHALARSNADGIRADDEAGSPKLERIEGGAAGAVNDGRRALREATNVAAGGTKEAAVGEPRGGARPLLTCSVRAARDSASRA